ncbi:hypothetical protein [Hufsiella ginkgonis]|uniref:Uncharacterized protein n=1 Tax=Hufsiella ginkgonis TaxID=2695274 RepID=A0A7K1Y1K3_9SPHI|nr:hypothetical protein [Hufsiella ginkgonis]MXV16899.1 hypothetical protein [Hufsiella ginkgonis]
MNRDFLSNFERSETKREAPVEDSEGSSAEQDVEFRDGDYIRNVCFVWPDGRRKFIPYGRLDSGEIDDEYETIRLTFGVEIVELTGVRLLPLFYSFMEHKRKIVYCDDPRYNELSDNGSIVNNIVIVQNT